MSRDYNKRWPEQARAKWLVQKKVQRREIVKPDRCQRCGKSFPLAKLQAHHRDYSRPTDVAWYCDACRRAVHKELGKDWKLFAGFAVTQVLSLETGGGGRR